MSVRSERFALCLKERRRSQNEGSLKSERANSKSDVPSSDSIIVSDFTSKVVHPCWMIRGVDNPQVGKTTMNGKFYKMLNGLRVHLMGPEVKKLVTLSL